MEFRCRKLLPTPDVNKTTICNRQDCISFVRQYGYCPSPCDSTYPDTCLYFAAQYIPPPPPPPTHHNDAISTLLIILASLLGGFLLFLSFCMCIVKYRAKLRRSSVELNDTHEDFIDVNRGPVFDHPIWFITRAGLQDSIINSITVCKYKRGEGLIEGTECSVCLSEFEDDETLRLLPKCSHAFHLPCVDTWLRSHTNCPLCRANIVSNTSGSSFTATIPSLNDSNTGNEIQIENPHSFRGLGSDRIEDGALNDIRVGIEDEGNSRVEDGRNDIEITKEGVSSSHVNCGFRVLSDLVNSSVMDNEIQPRRRSVSMDSSLASVIFLSIANAFPEESLGVSNNQLVQLKKSNSGFHFKKASGNKNMFKLIGSSSMGRSLKKGPISMKRSFSSGGKFLLSTSS